MPKNGDTGIRYQVAVNLWSTLVQSSWSRFNAMVIANSIIIGLTGTILNNSYGNNILLLFAVFLSVMGILLAFCWYSLMARDAKFQSYYAMSARNLERRLFADTEGESPSAPHLTVLDGAKLSAGFIIKSPDDPVYPDNIDKNDKNTIQMTGRSERWMARNSVNYIIYIFIFIYAMLIFIAGILYFIQVTEAIPQTGDQGLVLALSAISLSKEIDLEDLIVAILTACLVGITYYYYREMKKQATAAERQVGIMETQAENMKNQYNVMRMEAEQGRMDRQRDAIKRRLDKLVLEKNDLIAPFIGKGDDHNVWRWNLDRHNRDRTFYTNTYVPIWNETLTKAYLNPKLGEKLIEYKTLSENYVFGDKTSEDDAKLENLKSQLVSDIASRDEELRIKIDELENNLNKLESYTFITSGARRVTDTPT